MAPFVYPEKVDRMARLLVYVDGFNLYYGFFLPGKKRDGRPSRDKWIDPNKLAIAIAQQIWQDESEFEVVHIRYCTSEALADANDPDLKIRQTHYLNALDSLENLKLILGSFVERQKNARLYSPGHRVNKHASQFYSSPEYDEEGDPMSPSYSTLSTLVSSGHTCEQVFEWEAKKHKVKPNGIQDHTIRVAIREEKGSDVNLAAYLVRDCIREEFDYALVISNDSDLADAIALAREESGKPIYVASPHYRNVRKAFPIKDSRQQKLIDSASGYHVIDTTVLPDCQFPDEVWNAKSGITARRPKDWR